MLCERQIVPVDAVLEPSAHGAEPRRVVDLSEPRMITEHECIEGAHARDDRIAQGQRRLAEGPERHERRPAGQPVPEYLVELSERRQRDDTEPARVEVRPRGDRQPVGPEIELLER